jgi:hypothetical protein
MLWNGGQEAGNVNIQWEEDEDTDYEHGESDTDWWR